MMPDFIRYNRTFPVYNAYLRTISAIILKLNTNITYDLEILRSYVVFFDRVS